MQLRERNKFMEISQEILDKGMFQLNKWKMKPFRVTEVLSPYQDFSMIREDVLMRAAERGTEVHQACSAYALGAWVRPLKADAQGYFDSFKRWFDHYVEHVYFTEKELIDRDLGFYGHPDFYLLLSDKSRMVVDIKTPASEAVTWKAQISAYQHLVEKNVGANGNIHSMSLRLMKDGGVARGNVYQYSADDFAAFLSALNAYRYFKS
jgi:hypothetical protein